MRVHIKVCGITDIASAQACLDGGVDSIGFVFADSVRRVTPEAASRISSAVPGPMKRVAVFRQPKAGDIRRALEIFRADLVQADHRFLHSVDRHLRLPVFRESPGVEDEIDTHMGGETGMRFVYEGPVSGAGRPVDWPRAGQLATRGRMTLAGGLTPANVAEAVRLVRPFGVDVSSGVETAGKKDPEKIREFVKRARDA